MSRRQQGEAPPSSGSAVADAFRTCVSCARPLRRLCAESCARPLRPFSAFTSLFLPHRRTAAEPDPNQPYSATRSDPVTYDIDFRVRIARSPPQEHQETARVGCSVPQSDKGQEVKPGTFATFPADVKPTHCTRKTCLPGTPSRTSSEFDSPHRAAAQIISAQFFQGDRVGAALGRGPREGDARGEMARELRSVPPH